MAATITEDDLQLLRLYAERHMLPMRRLQKQMALAAMAAAGGAGELDDYVLQYRAPEPETQTTELAMTEMQAMTGRGFIAIAPKLKRVA